MAFHKPHFDLIAQALRKARDDGANDGGTIDAVAWQFAMILRETNIRFDVPRFIAACGVQVQPVGANTDPRD